MMQNCLFVNSTRSVIKCARQTKHDFICLLNIVSEEEHITRPRFESNPLKHTQNTIGWQSIDRQLVPVFLTLGSVRKGCMEIIACQSKAGCGTMRWKCQKCKLLCTGACRYMAEDTVVSIITVNKLCTGTLLDNRTICL